MSQHYQEGYEQFLMESGNEYAQNVWSWIEQWVAFRPIVVVSLSKFPSLEGLEG